MLTLAFGFGNPMEWAVIAMVALVIFGPKRMPELGKQLGQAMKEFRKFTEEFSGVASSVREEVESVYKPVLHGPSLVQTTSSPTVENAMTHRSYDQEPTESLPTPPKPGGLTLSTLPPETPPMSSDDAKGHL